MLKYVIIFSLIMIDFKEIFVNFIYNYCAPLLVIDKINFYKYY